MGYGLFIIGIGAALAVGELRSRRRRAVVNAERRREYQLRDDGYRNWHG